MTTPPGTPQTPTRTKKEEETMKKITKRIIRKDRNFQAFLDRNAEKIIRVQSNADIMMLRNSSCPKRNVDVLIHTDYHSLPFRISIRRKGGGAERVIWKPPWPLFSSIRRKGAGPEWEIIQNPLTILHHTPLQDQEGWEETIEKIFLAKDSEKARRILQEYLKGLDKEVKEKLVEDVRRKLEEKILDLL